MLLDSKTKSNASTGAEERLSKIPTMVSAISRRISEFRLSYRRMVDDAETFFAEYKQRYLALKNLRRKIEAFQTQIDMIESYRREKGRLPAIKGQASTERYMQKLVAQLSALENELKSAEARLRKEKNNRYERLDHLTDQMLDLLDGHKIFSQFLGSIALSTPSPEDKVRHVRNEKYKPIFVTALAIALFEEVRTQTDFTTPYLKDALNDIFPTDEPFSLMVDKSELADGKSAFYKVMPAEMKIKYRENILKPLAKAALLQSIGSHSLEVNSIFGDDRYRQLNQEERDKLLAVIDAKTNDYIKLGIGLPGGKFDSKEQRDEFLGKERKSLQFTLSILNALKKTGNELGDLLRIPMTYSSFILSTKKEFDYKQIYQAYDVIAQGKASGQYNAGYVDAFLSMVGRFPLGSGIYFIQQETGEVERAIVSSLYPPHPDEPICKQITRRQLQFLSHIELVISKPTNMFFEESRAGSHYSAEFFDMKFKGEYTWNATELWEVQIPPIEFWKKDGARNYNSLYNPDSY